jgi:hypothetical protein
MRGGNVSSVMRGGRGRCTHHTAARRHSHSHSVCLHHAAHPQSTHTTVLHPRVRSPPHHVTHCLSTQTTSTYNCPLLTDHSPTNSLLLTSLSQHDLLLTDRPPTTACSSQASLSLSAPHRQAVLHSLLLTSARTHTHTASHTAQHQTQPRLPLCFRPPRHQTLSLSTPRLRRTAPKLNYIYSKLTLNYKPIN